MIPRISLFTAISKENSFIGELNKSYQHDFLVVDHPQTGSHLNIRYLLVNATYPHNVFPRDSATTGLIHGVGPAVDDVS